MPGIEALGGNHGSSGKCGKCGRITSKSHDINSKILFSSDLTLALASSIAHGDSSIVPSSQTIGTLIIPFKIDQTAIIYSTII